MTVTLAAIALDCADADQLAQFWAGVLDEKVEADASAEFAMITPADGPAWMFNQVPEGKAAKNRVHPDLMTSDLGGETDRVVGLGATKLGDPLEAGGHRWVTFADPQGNEFDIAEKM